MKDDDRAHPGTTISLTQIEAFQAVAQAGSFTRAARLLGKSQPAVNRLVAALSRTVGVSLFERDGALMAPTSEARRRLAETGCVLQSAAGFEQSSATFRTERPAGCELPACPASSSFTCPTCWPGSSNSGPMSRSRRSPFAPNAS